MVKTVLALVLLGALLVIFCQRRPVEQPAPAPAPAVIVEETPAKEVVVIPPAASEEGPAEKIGAVADDVLHSMGDVAIKAGQAIKEATEEAAHDNPVIVVAPSEPQKVDNTDPPAAMPPATADPLAEVDKMLETPVPLPTNSPAPVSIEEF